jgi:hypothetical protein
MAAEPVCARKQTRCIVPRQPRLLGPATGDWKRLPRARLVSLGTAAALQVNEADLKLRPA